MQCYELSRNLHLRHIKKKGRQPDRLRTGGIRGCRGWCNASLSVYTKSKGHVENFWLRPSTAYPKLGFLLLAICIGTGRRIGSITLVAVFGRYNGTKGLSAARARRRDCTVLLLMIVQIKKIVHYAVLMKSVPAMLIVAPNNHISDTIRIQTNSA